MNAHVFYFRRYFVPALAAFWLLAGVAVQCAAASFERKDVHSLAVQAETIVVGRISSQQSRRLTTGLIVTDFTIAVERRIKGPGTGPTEVVTMAGGAIGAESQAVVGFPNPVAGARYLLFIGRQRTAVVPFVGGHQGMYRIERDADTQEDIVGDATGRPIRAGDDPTAGGHAPEAQAKDGGPNLRLSDFLSQVRQILDREAAP